MSDIDRLNTNLLFTDVCNIIDNARLRLAKAANSEITLLFWNVGSRINNEILDNQRAEYGKEIVSTLSTQLVHLYGSDYELRKLRRMLQFATVFTNYEIVSTVSTQLSWSHFVELLPLKEDLQKEFYLQMCLYERWSVKILREKIDSMLYERTAISGKPEEFIKQELSDLSEKKSISADLVFKNPYFLNFTGLKGFYSEKTLEDVLITELEHFILELGNGFSFVERQKRMLIDGEDFYLDLLFYHRKLRRLVAIELKTGKFKAYYKGQMELYLQWLEKYEKQEGEESPIGLILCPEGGKEQIELLQLEKSGIKAAQYFTELPDKKLLEEQLKKSIQIAKMRFEENQKNND